MLQFTIVACAEPLGYVPEEQTPSQRKFTDNIVLRKPSFGAFFFTAPFAFRGKGLALRLLPQLQSTPLQRLFPRLLDCQMCKTLSFINLLVTKCHHARRATCAHSLILLHLTTTTEAIVVFSTDCVEVLCMSSRPSRQWKAKDRSSEASKSVQAKSSLWLLTSP